MIRRKISSGMFIKLGFLAFLALLWPFLRRPPRLAAAIISLILQFSLFLFLLSVMKTWPSCSSVTLLGLTTPSKNSNQVWTLTQFFLFPLGKKIIDLPGGLIHDPSSGKHNTL